MLREPHRSGFLILFFLLLFSVPAAGDAASVVLFESGIETGSFEDNEYLTTGAVLLSVAPGEVRRVLADTSNFHEWLLNGMGEQAARKYRLKVSLNDLSIPPDSPSSCLIGFSLFITRHLVVHDKHISVHVTASPEHSGWVRQVRYTLPFSGSFVSDGQYHVYLFPMGDGKTLVVFRFTIRLSGIAQLLFSERLYARNIEWYIRKILMNCADYLVTD